MPTASDFSLVICEAVMAGLEAEFLAADTLATIGETREARAAAEARRDACRFALICLREDLAYGRRADV